MLSVLSSKAVQVPSFEALRNDLREKNSSIQNIDAKCDALSERILDDVKEANTVAKEARDIALSGKAANEKLEEKALTDETDITAADSYYDVVYDNYMDQLDSLNYATDTCKHLLWFREYYPSHPLSIYLTDAFS